MMMLLLIQSSPDPAWIVDTAKETAKLCEEEGTYLSPRAIKKVRLLIESAENMLNKKATRAEPDDSV
jgi:hypothetical protein